MFAWQNWLKSKRDETFSNPFEMIAGGNGYGLWNISTFGPFQLN